MRVRPVRAAALAAEVADRVAALGPGRLRVIVDGPPPARPEELAGALAELLRVHGRPTMRVSARDFLRPASVRLEHGRQDPDELLSGWLDEAGLRREVLDPAGPDGSGQVLPRLWDAAADRAFRERRVTLADNAVLLLDGALLLGRDLPAEFGVHLRMSAAALARTMAPELRWTLPTYHRYDEEYAPSAVADAVILADDPQRPAILDP